jgi:putative PIN family toxin of toxin-antitoxin system
VFDTNVYISAFILPTSQANRAITRILDGQDTLLISRPILDEVLSTLGRKFSRDAEALSQVAVFLSDLTEAVVPQRSVRVFEDNPDNRVLECAEAGQADLIVTGDKAMLQLGHFRGIRLVSLREYLYRS